MVRRRERDPTKAGRLETLGAWLHVWTPPRDVEIPPVPWGRVVAGAAALAVLAGLVALFVAPRSTTRRPSGPPASSASLDARAAVRRQRLVEQQRARFGRAEGDRPAVMADVEDAIGADARARFDPDARRASCEPSPGVDPAARRVAFDCVSGIRDIVGAADQEGARGLLAIPFRAVVDFERGTYAFCKVNPPPGEQVIPDPRKIVALPPPCRIPAA
jgi:hypothetical protein